MNPKHFPAVSRPGPGLEVGVLALFFFSGAAALVYEVVWTREMTYVFGGSAFAIATVLAAFMAGLALGSKVFGRLIDRRGHPLVVYAVLEAAIGGFALVLPFLFDLLDGLYAGVYRSFDSGYHTLGLIRFALSFLVLLVPTTLMGGTLPVLGRLLIREEKTLGLRAGLLYGVNTLGAVAGVAGGGFVLLPWLGLWGATHVAVVMNLVIAGVAWALSRRFAAAPVTVAITEDGGRDVPGTQPNAPSLTLLTSTRSTLRRVVLIVYAASGFAALAYEVAWTKTLSMVLGTTTYAFSAMLVTFLLGLSVGSALCARVADRIRHPAATLALVQAGIPLLALATLPVMGQLPQLYVDAFPALQGSWVKVELYRFFLAAAVMFLPTVLMGATFPLVSRVYLGRETMGSSLGSLYAANTVGAILGSFVTGFILVPWLGRQASILVACGVNVAAVAMLVSAIRWSEAPVWLRWAAIGALAAMVPAFLLGYQRWDPRILASGAYVYADKYARAGSIDEALAGNHLVLYEEDTEGTVSVWQREYQTNLRINGKVDASSHGDMLSQKFIAHLPALYHRGDMKTGLVIGLGSGVSAGGLLSHPIDRVETVELMPGMVPAARHFNAFNRNPLDDPRHHLIVNDGRNHLKLTDRRYDVIVSEPSNPWIAGIGALFTREFFEIARDRLQPGGILGQWVQIYDFHADDVRAVFATILEVFPHVHVWQGAPGDLILVAGMEPLRLDRDGLEAALAGGPGEDLASVEVLPLTQMLSYFVTDETGMKTLIGDRRQRVTDDNLYLEYAVPRHMVDRRGGVKLSDFEAVRKDPLNHVDASHPGEREAIERYRASRGMVFRAHYENSVPMGAELADVLRAAHLAAPDEFLSRKLWTAHLLREGVAHMQSERNQEAETIFRAVTGIGLREQQATAHLYLGTMASRERRYAEAAAAWKTCLSLEPRYPEAYVQLASLALRDERVDEAEELLARAVELAPTHTQAWVRRARIHVQREDWARAEASLKPARRGNPWDPDLLFVEGVLRLKTGDPHGAAERFARVLAVEPRRAEAAYNLAVAEEGRGLFEDAAAAWRYYLELKPGNAHAQSSLAWLLATELGQPAEAEVLARAALAGGASANYLDTLAESLFRQGKVIEAVAAARQAVSLDDQPYYREQLVRFQKASP